MARVGVQTLTYWWLAHPKAEPCKLMLKSMPIIIIRNNHDETIEYIHPYVTVSCSLFMQYIKYEKDGKTLYLGQGMESHTFRCTPDLTDSAWTVLNDVIAYRLSWRETIYEIFPDLLRQCLYFNGTNIKRKSNNLH